MIPRLLILASWAVASAFAQSSARADTWTLCNNTAKKVDAVIAYDAGDGNQFTTKGWFILNPCHGCVTVLSGHIPLKGVFFHAHEEEGGGQFNGRNSFCVKDEKFVMPNASISARDCKARGGYIADFQEQDLNAKDFTTTLNPANNESHCID